MAQKVAKLGIKRDNNYLYYIKDGDVWQARLKRPGVKKSKNTKVADGGVKQESGYMYVLDKDGDIARTKASVGGQKKKKKATKPARRATAKKAATKKTAAKKTTAKKTTAKAKAKPRTAAKAKARRR